MEDSIFQLNESLTEREQDVLFAMADGLSNQEIANRLHIALATVKWYNTQLYSKLAVQNRSEAVDRARLLGLLDNDETHNLHIPNNLPHESTAFVGRNQELYDLNEVINQADTRLLTIIGQGGMGKTRIALQLAQYNLHHHSDGVYFIQLAPLSNAQTLPNILATILGIQHYGDDTDIQTNICNYLKSKNTLLLFDNFEHLLDARSLLTAILNTCPNVKLLVTSRERLNLQGEYIYALSGMNSPKHETNTLTDNDAILLFLQSTRRIRSDYILSDDDLAHIARICRLVDGLPLGIELAAGWMDTLSAEQIADEIEHSLDILETDLQDIPERHRSIQATFERTWQSLTETEQQAMMSISLFRSGFTTDAANYIALANIRILKRLVNKSLLYYHPNGRYTIHELLRQYLAEKLIYSDEYEVAIERFMSYFADYAKTQLQPMRDFVYSAYETMRRDWDNIAVAWQMMLDRDCFDFLENTFLSMSEFSAKLGYSFECVALFEPAIEQLRQSSQENHNLHLLLGRMLLLQSDLKLGIDSEEAVLRDSEEAIAILEKEAPSRWLFAAYDVRFHLKQNHRNTHIDQLHAEKMLDVAKKIKLHAPVPWAYYRLWTIQQQAGNEDSSKETLKKSYELWSEYKNANPYDSHNANSFIPMLLQLKKYDEAKPLIVEQIAKTERIEWVYGISIARSNMMQLALETNKIDLYKQQVASILSWHKKCARDWQTLGALADAHVRSLRHFEKYEKVVEVCSFVIHHPVVVNKAVNIAEYHLENMQQYLDEQTMSDAYERGKTRTLNDMVDEALAYWED